MAYHSDEHGDISMWTPSMFVAHMKHQHGFTFSGDPINAFHRHIKMHEELSAAEKAGRANAGLMSPDAPVVTNERGGGQSALPARFDLFDPKAMEATARVLHEGAEKYAPGNWRLIPVRDHLNHLLGHVYSYLDGDTSDEHLSHAVCRAMFALGVDLDPDATPDKDLRGS